MRNIFLLSFIISALFFSNVNAENNPFSFIKKSNSNFLPAPSYSKKIVEGGFYFHLGLMVPTKNYYCPKGVNNNTNERFNIGGGLEIGDLFQLAESKSNVSFGLRFTYLNALYTSYSNNGKTTEQVLQGSAFDLGPSFTIGLDKQNAIDIYYQLCPTYMYNLKDTLGYTSSGSFGLNHTFALGYRFNLLSIAVIYNMGNVKYIDAKTNDKYMKHRMDHFRFCVGMMF